jgi:hypothetical protein
LRTVDLVQATHSLYPSTEYCSKIAQNLVSKVQQFQWRSHIFQTSKQISKQWLHISMPNKSTQGVTSNDFLGLYNIYQAGAVVHARHEL